MFMETHINKKTLKTIGIIVAAIVLFLGGIYTGKKTTPVKTITKIKYVEAEPIHDSIDKPVPVYIKEPVDVKGIIAQAVKDGIYQELFPEKIKEVKDTVYMTNEDTLKIIADWATKREYNETLFNSDTLGTFKFKADVQYNRLNNISYDFYPKQKVVTQTVYRTRTLLPYVGVGATTFPSATAEAGVFVNQSWGIAVDGHYYPNSELYEYMSKYDIGVKIMKMF